MKLMKSLLLGSAAGLCAVAGAQAADLPVRKAAPVEYVRVCTIHGAGFFYIPGTDTCIRIGGRVRFEYQYTEQRTSRDVSGFRSIGRLNLDSRTATPYGTLRAFVRMDIYARSGAYLNSGTAQRFALAFPGLGQDTFGRTQKHVDIDKAFIQFAGITAGRASSFFDFYATDLEFINANLVSNVSATNLLAYTATFGGGFSATVSAEDPIWRRNPVFATTTPAGGFGTGSASLPLGAGATVLGPSAFSPIALNNGVANSVAFVDVAQRSRMPDFVGALRLDQAWGSAQIMGAVHEIALGNTAGGTIVPNVGPGGPLVNRRFDQTVIGYGIGGGVKLNLPQLAPGDQLWLQVAYSDGANAYTGLANPHGAELIASSATRGGTYGQIDAALTQAGRLVTTEVYSANLALLHYWSPEVRSALFGSWARAHFDGSLRTAVGPAGGQGINSNLFRDYNSFYMGTNIAYSPVRDLDFGVEVVYQRLEALGGASRGRIADANKPGLTFNGIDDNVLVRLRIQRDF